MDSNDIFDEDIDLLNNPENEDEDEDDDEDVPMHDAPSVLPDQDDQQDQDMMDEDDDEDGDDDGNDGEDDDDNEDNDDDDEEEEDDADGDGDGDGDGDDDDDDENNENDDSLIKSGSEQPDSASVTETPIGKKPTTDTTTTTTATASVSPDSLKKQTSPLSKQLFPPIDTPKDTTNTTTTSSTASTNEPATATTDKPSTSTSTSETTTTTTTESTKPTPTRSNDPFIDDNSDAPKKAPDSEQPPPAQQQPKSPSPVQTLREKLVEKAKTTTIVEVSPHVAIPYAVPVHSLAVTRGPKWMFTGGEDGIIRKFDFFGSVEGKSPLTVAQRHQLVDSISFGGLMNSYWENEQPYYKDELLKMLVKEAEAAVKPTRSKKKNQQQTVTVDPNGITSYEPRLSPVYSLAVESNGFWLLSGLKSGGITLQSVRSGEGVIRYYFREGKGETQHSSTVSCLKMNSDETRFLSGSWDQKILQWDLNTGQNITSFVKSTGQISSLDFRPVGGMDLALLDDGSSADGDISKNDEDKKDDDLDSLFGGSDDDDDDDTQLSIKDKDTTSKSATDTASLDANSDSHEETMKQNIKQYQQETVNAGYYEGCVRSDNVFLSSSINGTVNIWDARLSAPNNEVASIGHESSNSPWCMSAIWSVSGNEIYAGRRNAVVDEFDLRKMESPKRQFKFPAASGPISCVRTLPNKDYLLCGCQDNVRLYDLKLAEEELLADSKKKKKIPFMIIPGHNGGILSDLYVDPTCRFMISSSGNRGWQGKCSEYVFIYRVLST
ncbi:unnamed protein product [Ambrosiozyma monospora]|uniref:Unnamed protein product n=1 Tax=Ambrosiozyma monospora TaxID=43982 RepID=A0ACB5SSP5_AMBMO|nr:unnamed protein product [Ambrosiozyma monospora]